MRDQVLAAAVARGAALVASDVGALRRLLHPDFRWISRTRQRFDRGGASQAMPDLRWTSPDRRPTDNGTRAR